MPGKSPKAERQSSLQGLVHNTLGFARVYSDVQLHKTEENLERELRRESCYPAPDEKVARLCLKGEHILHSKQVLLAVVILNLIDCTLVLGELILDIHFIRELRTEADITSQSFIDTLQVKYPDQIYGYDIENLSSLYQKLYQADCTWSKQKHTQTQTQAPLQAILITDIIHGNSTLPRLRRRSAHDVIHEREVGYNITENNQTERTGGHHHHHHEHSIWEHLAHGMHKASITILGILFFENIIKVICMRKAFFIKKLEVFDAIVVIISFVVDLILLKGLNEFSVQDAVFVLTFLLPWRVIRVVNSLIVAVLDQEHFRLKMLYQEKKAIANELKSLKDQEKRWDFHLQKIEKFCESEGIPKWKIRQHTAMGRKQSTITSMASLALNGFLQGIVLSPSDKALFDRSISMNSYDYQPDDRDNARPTAKEHHLDVISESEASDDEDMEKKDRRANSAIHFLDPNEIDDLTSGRKGSSSKRPSNSTIKSVTFEPPKEVEMKPLLKRQDSFDETKNQ